MAVHRKTTIGVCSGKSCGPRGSARILSYLQQQLEILKSNFGKDVEVRSCDCLGHCERGPNVLVNGIVANEVTADNSIQKIDEALKSPPPKIEIDIDKLMSSL